MKKHNILLPIISAALLTIPQVSTLATTPPTLIAQFGGDEQVGIEVYRKASPAVVTIVNGNGNGSGSIISSDGLVITNDHVVRGSSGVVQIRAANNKTYRGVVLANDRQNDLALVKIDSRDRFPTIPLANRSGIQVGQRVYAIGSPFGLSGTLTTGILSRIAPNGDLQTDAAINPGNSGGPLLNSRGELIGVNKAILTAGGRGNVGIGFATDVTRTQSFITANRNRNPNVARTPNRVPNSPNNPNNQNTPRGPRLGVTLDTQTLTVLDVAPNSPADSVGLQPGDRILAINNRRLANFEDLIDFLDTRPSSALLTIRRDRRVGRVRVSF